jgi:hypothetical protein
MSKKEIRILRTTKDSENSCVVIETDQGQDWISCAECRVGELECDYLKKQWSVDPCLYRKGVRLGKNLEPDPRDVVRIIQNNIQVYSNMIEKEGPLLKSERDIVSKVLGLELRELENAKSMLYRRDVNREGLNRQDGNTQG